MDARLTLLGQFSLTTDGRPIAVDPQSARVLVALAVNGSTTRPVVAGLLWPDAGRDRALANFRAVLWRMSPEVRDLVIGGCGEVSLHPGVAVDIHTLCLERLPNGTSPAEIGFTFSLAQLSAPLLAGWYDEWIIAERERVRACQVRLLQHRVRAHLEQDNAPAAVIDATWAVTIDPLNEHAHQLLLRSHLAEGNIKEAVVHFDYLRQLLDRELGVPPFPDTWEIIGQCLQ